MEAKATLRYLRMSPRKVRLVADLVRGRRVEEAIRILRFTPRRASLPVRKVIESAVANAENNHGLDIDQLWVREIRVDEGPTLKRWRPRARGRATPIMKRTSHVAVVLEER
ncbi:MULTISPECIES: 50S ribosomal protein L22 [Deferrisoma]|uniref:50S ribosomal protein L22 n=1 Tax=Deferrisoma camini TaxID=1035120 RepID=UPI00046D2D57|nr:50S ribosomal protein L22 [Deferrisoma camini]NOY46520.1 50S ribosomal protein L22 [Deltaproteobacteria bacterium]RMG85648.1 MAG: 50S ribosomal protein L22 [Candidatus Dadabacteria bacterium]